MHDHKTMLLCVGGKEDATNTDVILHCWNGYQLSIRVQSGFSSNLVHICSDRWEWQTSNPCHGACIKSKGALSSALPFLRPPRKRDLHSQERCCAATRKCTFLWHPSKPSSLTPYSSTAHSIPNFNSFSCPPLTLTGIYDLLHHMRQRKRPTRLL